MAEGWASGHWRKDKKALLVAASGGDNIWFGGFLISKGTKKLITTEVTTGAKASGGFLRSPSGVLVTKDGVTAEGLIWRGGFLRDTNNALVTTALESESPRYWGGFWRDKKGRLVIA